MGRARYDAIRHLIGAVAAAAATACANTPFPYDMYVDRQFTWLEQCLAVEAVDRWEAATGIVDVHAYIGARHWGYPHQIVRADEATAQRLSDNDLMVGQCQRRKNGADDGLIYIVPSRLAEHYDGEAYANAFLVTALHELGHHWGLGHVDGGIMAPTLPAGDYPPCVDQATIDRFCTDYGCSRIAPACEPAPDCGL